MAGFPLRTRAPPRRDSSTNSDDKTGLGIFRACSGLWLAGGSEDSMCFWNPYLTCFHGALPSSRSLTRSLTRSLA